MKISYDPSVDALYIRLVDDRVECEVIRLNDSMMSLSPLKYPRRSLSEA